MFPGPGGIRLAQMYSILPARRAWRHIVVSVLTPGCPGPIDAGRWPPMAVFLCLPLILIPQCQAGSPMRAHELPYVCGNLSIRDVAGAS
jgi:hypothetical protein